MTDKTELLPCPFCGGEAECEMHFTHKIFRVTCAGSQCHIMPRTVWYTTEAEAIAAWNTRAERTCEIESSYLNDFTSKYECWYEFEMQCGYRFTWDEMEPPRFCPNCGGEVKVADA